MPDTPVVADQLSIYIGRKKILDNLSFTLKPGTITGLIGPSGSGKTTLMRTIVGVQKISSGKLEVLGAKAGHSTLRSQLGYVSQTPSVYQDLTVRQNLSYFSLILKSSHQKVSEVLELVDLSSQTNQMVGSLSGGQRTRVSLAIALLGQPQVLVLDEPTVGLDPLLRRQLWDLFDRLAHQGKTLLISSHVMDEAARCPELLLMRDGKLLWQQSQTELLKHTSSDSIEQAFISLIGTAS